MKLNIAWDFLFAVSLTCVGFYYFSSKPLVYGISKLRQTFMGLALILMAIILALRVYLLSVFLDIRPYSLFMLTLFGIRDKDLEAFDLITQLLGQLFAPRLDF